jgi:hypothetical protein
MRAMHRVSAAACAGIIVVLVGVPALGQHTPPPPEKKETASGGGVDLRPKFRKGEDARFKLEMTSTNRTKTGGASTPAAPTPSKPTPGRRGPQKPPAPVTGDDAAPSQTENVMKQEIGLRLHVTEAQPEGGAVVELVYESLKLSVQSDGVLSDFDSTKPPSKNNADDPIAAMLKPMVGSVIKLKVDKDGNITDVSGGNGLVPSALLGDLGGGSGGGDAKSMFGSLFSIKKGNGRARIGEKWTDVDVMESSPIGNFKMTTENTLKSAAGGKATVDFTGTMAPDSEGGAGNQGLVQVKEAKYDGRYVWDTERGMLDHMDSHQNVVMDAKVGEGGTSMKSETTVKVTRVEGGAARPKQ